MGGGAKRRQQKRKQEVRHMFQVESDTQDRMRENGKRTSSVSNNLLGNLLGKVAKVWHGH